MKLTVQIASVLSAFWATITPAMYGLLFVAVGDWSAAIDVLIVLFCIVLAVAAFARIPFTVWLVCFTCMLGLAVAGFFYHFRGSGESGPLPFEWINGYFIHAAPILVSSVLMKIYAAKTKAEQVRPANLATLGG
jgi:hypothetical protein